MRLARTLVVCVQAMQQPAGRLSQRQHLNCVLPLFLEPAGTYVLYTAWNLLQTLASTRNRRHLAAGRAKLKKLVAELKVSSFRTCLYSCLGCGGTRQTMLTSA